MASNSYASTRRAVSTKSGQTDPLTSALMKRAADYGPVKHAPGIKFITPDIKDMSASELDDLIKTGGGTFESFSPAEWSAIEARLKVLGL